MHNVDGDHNDEKESDGSENDVENDIAVRDGFGNEGQRHEKSWQKHEHDYQVYDSHPTVLGRDIAQLFTQRKRDSGKKSRLKRPSTNGE